MDCPSIATLEQQLRDGEPDAAIAAHVTDCARCQAERAALRTLPSPPVAAATLLPAQTPVGRYRILGLLGRGGMGTVYAAHDPELDRTIAVKVLSADRLDEPETRARLQREGQALARLSHRNVVTVYDVGTCAHGVFIAMERIEGETLRQWLARPRSHAAILATFVAAGRGLAAAHGAGLVHRDFKPENVLIGADGRVCVTDFGLARVAGSAAAAGSSDGSSPLTTPITLHGTVPGTPAYMAPEQLSDGVVDVRSDLFSFCVALWEALAGVSPFAGGSRRQLLAAMVSGRLQAGRIGSAPRRVRRLLRRGLAVAPEARPASLAELLAALEPPSRRRRWLAAGGLALAGPTAALVVGLRPRPCDGSGFATVWNPATRATVAQAFAATGVPWAAAATARVAATLDGYRDRWRDMALSACQSARVRHEQSAALFDLRMQCLDERRSAAGALVALLAHADRRAVERAVTATESLEPLDRCAQVALLRATDPPPRDPQRRARIDALRRGLDSARALNQLGRYTEALAATRPLAQAAAAIGHPPLVAETLLLRGWLEYVQSSDFATVRATLVDAAAAAVAGHDDRALAEALVLLVRAHLRNNEPQTLENGRAWAKLAATWLDRVGADDLLRVRLLDAEGELYTGQFHFDEALAAYDRAIALETRGGHEALLGRTLWARGQALAAQGNRAEAERTLERSKVALERTLGPNHPTTGQTLYMLGKLLVDSGPLDRAEAYTRRAERIMEDALGPRSPRLALSLSVLGNVLLLQDRPDEALPAFRRALALRAPEDELEQDLDRIGIAGALDRQGHRAEALQALGSDVEHAHDATARGLLLVERGELALHARRPAPARADFEAALAALTQAADPYDEDFATALVGLGNSWLARHEPAPALPPLERALTRTKAVAPRVVAHAELALAHALVDSHGDVARAARLARSAVDRLAPLGPLGAREAADATRWLETALPAAAP